MFLKVIPKSKLKSDKIPEFIKKTFSEIETCPICGVIVLIDILCLSCGTDIFDEIEHKFWGFEFYVLDKQSLFFQSFYSGHSILINGKDEYGFLRDKSWEPIPEMLNIPSCDMGYNRKRNLAVLQNKRKIKERF